MCRPRTDAIFKFSVSSTDIIYFDENKKPVEIRDYGYRLKRTFIYTNQSICVCSDRRMMTRTCFKLKVLKGGYKLSNEDYDLMREKP